MCEKSRAPDLGSERVVEGGLGDPFTAAFRTTRMAMVITDPRQDDNPIIFVNDAFSDLTGYTRDEVLGRNCRFLQGPETGPEDVEQVRAAIRAGESLETEILNYRKDGSSFWNALVISPVRDEAGQLLYFFASQFDITPKKEAELALQDAKQALQQEVARRTQDLQAALDQKTALLHEVDHRVKNNLQVVSSLVLLKARRIQDPTAQQVLHNMAERISALSTVHRLLYSAGDVSRFDVQEFASDLGGDLMSTLNPGQVELDLAVDPIPVPAAKATSLALLLNELMSNALKHAFPEDRKGKLLVGIARREGGIEIVVEDDGIGMASHAESDESFGKLLIEMLVRQLRATIRWEDAQPGTRAVILMPLNADEAQL